MLEGNALEVPVVLCTHVFDAEGDVWIGSQAGQHGRQLSSVAYQVG
jgi:streptogramin lyase